MLVEDLLFSVTLSLSFEAHLSKGSKEKLKRRGVLSFSTSEITDKAGTSKEGRSNNRERDHTTNRLKRKKENASTTYPRGSREMRNK